MAKPIYPSHLLLFLLVVLHCFHHSQQSQSQSQWLSLMEIQKLLNYPSALSSFKYSRKGRGLCSIEPTPSLTLACYQGIITQLHITGNNGFPPLPNDFSSHSFFASIAQLPSLKVLSLTNLGLWGPIPPTIAHLSSLEILNVSTNYLSGNISLQISSLRNLQTLILDQNKFTGQVPAWLSSLPVLSVLSLKNNLLNGSLPYSFSSLQTLRVVSLSHNYLSGEVPDLTNLTNLQVLDLEDNYFGPHFPSLPNKLVTLVLRKNKFRLGIQTTLDSSSSSWFQLQKLDISLNEFVGPFVPSLLSLPSINYLDIGGNKFNGVLFKNISCNAELAFVNLSSNLLTGELPSCLKKSRISLYTQNCLANEDQEQHPSSLCHNEALAVRIPPSKEEHKRHYAKQVISLSAVGGIVGAIAVVGLVFVAVKRSFGDQHQPTTRFITDTASAVNTAKLLSDAKYISETMKMGASIPAYRTFALEELKEATNNFDDSTLLGKDSDGQIYRGKLCDGTLVAIRGLKMRKRHNPQVYTHLIELISKLRHGHLVSALGHCLELHPDDSSVSRLFLISEFVPNGTLRGCISEAPPGRKLNWAQRIVAAIGVAKGIQFLHTGIVPGVKSINLKIKNVLMDHGLHVKISNYSLALLAENRGVVGTLAASSSSKGSFQARVEHECKNDVYDFGVILLEIILGRPIMFQNEVGVLKDLLRVSLTTDDIARRNIVDPAVHKECSDESLKTMMEICVRCLSNEPTDRPSVEDILWNLQFAAQLQDSTSHLDSPVSSSHSQQV
uniref:probable inactive leucine-rich repeat receptor-like protein kinase At3g03770 n=1 Tax=Fragaria vesca subsp. vesca TaxID=101020 RepID=UPI0005CAD52F|nr:PREDICTED: probable inactive leucine-rich repeat receptor-like protein kinase At3g03770 [Fragaria vesca subsp. vesca]